MINVAIIEDNAQYRQTLAIILQLSEDIHLLHRLNDCSNMTTLFSMNTPDVVIMDIDLPEISGIEGVKILKRQWPEIKIIMLTVFEDSNKIFEAIKAGADGYLLKKDKPEKILESIHLVSKGEAPVNGLIAAKLLEFFKTAPKKSEQPELSSLTNREQELLALLVQGYSYKQIASDMCISVETLNSHIKNIYKKLNVHSRAEVAARYGNYLA